MSEIKSIEINWPEYHYSGMGCGLEDRGIHDRYDAMLYGWTCAVERCVEAIPDEALLLASDVSALIVAKDAEIARLREALTEAYQTMTGEDACGIAPIVGSDNPHEHAAGLVRKALEEAI